MYNVISTISTIDTLGKLRVSIDAVRERFGESVKWFLVFDSVKPLSYPLESWIYYYCCKSKVVSDGSEQRNFILDILTKDDGWIYFLNENTQIDLGMFDTVSRLSEECPALKGISFSRDNPMDKIFFHRGALFGTRFKKDHNFWKDFQKSAYRYVTKEMYDYRECEVN